MNDKPPVDRDTSRDALLTRRAALMAAAGKPDKEITASLGVSQAVLSHLKNSPLWQQLVITYADELEERGVQSIVDELMTDAPKNVKFIKKIRDGNFDDDHKKLDFRMRAAKMLLDKQAPNADARMQAESAARIILDGKLLSQILGAMREVGAIDITPANVEKATAAIIPQLFGAKTPEQFSAEYKETDPEDEL